MCSFRQFAIVLLLILGGLLKCPGGRAIQPRCMHQGRKHQRKNYQKTDKSALHARHYKIGLDDMQSLLKMDMF
jgi:hypothetical protein